MSRAIVIVDHGSRAEEANTVVEHIADGIRRRRPDLIVEAAHMELAEPSLADAIDRCVERGAREVVVSPYFLGPGRHLRRDIPNLVEQARAAHPELVVSIAEPLGVDERMVDLVLARVDALLE